MSTSGIYAIPSQPSMSLMASGLSRRISSLPSYSVATPPQTESKTAPPLKTAFKRVASRPAMVVRWGDEVRHSQFSALNAEKKTSNKLKKPPPDAGIPTELQSLPAVSPFVLEPFLDLQEGAQPQKGLFRFGNKEKTKAILREHPVADVEAEVEADWVDHNTYFPEYEPIMPNLAPAQPAANINPSRTYDYYPDYEPVYPLLVTAGAQTYAIAPDHAVMNERAARMSLHSVQWPHLPALSDYTGVSGQDKGKTVWHSAAWGTPGWTGYGWEGEKIPNAAGQVFSAPMPKGEAILTEEEKKGQQGGGKKGGGGGGGGDGKTAEGGDDEGQAGQVDEKGKDEGKGQGDAQNEGDGEGGGGGKKKKKKK